MAGTSLCDKHYFEIGGEIELFSSLPIRKCAYCERRGTHWATFELLPCPFCGGMAKLTKRNGGWDICCYKSNVFNCEKHDEYGRILDWCSIELTTPMFECYEQAIKIWNKRFF